MRTLGLQRSVLLLFCVASVLLSGCVSKGKYNNLEEQYTGNSGQYKQVAGTIYRSAGTYRQLQQSSTAQAAQSSGNCRPEEGSCRREGAGRPAPGGHPVHRQQRLAVPVGLLGDVPQGKDLIAKLAPKLAPYQQTKLVVNGYTDNAPIEPALKREGVTSNEVLSQKRAEAVMQYLISQGAKPDMISARGSARRSPSPRTNRQGARAESPRRGDPGRANLAVTLRYL